jgi:hypothetical protein
MGDLNNETNRCNSVVVMFQCKNVVVLSDNRQDNSQFVMQLLILGLSQFIVFFSAQAEHDDRLQK